MAILDKPYGWVWVVLGAWLIVRLFLVVALAIVEAKNRRGLAPEKLVYLPFLSGTIFGFVAALGWRQFVEGPAGLVGCFSCVAWIPGFLVGLIFELLLLIRVQRPIAVFIVAIRAPTYADRLINGEPEQRIDAANALAFIGPKAAFAATQLLDALKDSDPALRVAVTRAIFGINVEDSAIDQAMVKGLADSDSNVRTLSACVLAMRGHGEGALLLPHLVAGLRVPDRDAAILCADILGRLGPAAAPAISDLIEMLDAGSPMHYSAGDALARIGAQAVPEMVAKFETLDANDVRLVVVQAFARMGVEAVQALPLLEKLQTHSDMMIRRTARKAIRKIEKVEEQG